MKHLSEAKKAVRDLAPRIIEMNRCIFERPELNFNERFAAGHISSALAEEGFAVRAGAGKLKTAFDATWRGSRKGPVVAILSEYDALPNIGHACGHNMIAAASFGAAVAVRRLLGKNCGTLKVVGTPAEEGGGGKLMMIKEGWFKGVDAALMVHPANHTRTVARMLAVMEIEFKYYGKASHAAAHPELGINALDAVIMLFNSINALRQQTPNFSRVHGIVTHGGDAPNIIPEFASAKFFVRGITMADFRYMLAKVTDCAKASARATGCKLKVVKNPLVYQPFEPNRTLGKVFRPYAEALGLKDAGIPENEEIGSSDIGNLSQVVPCLHPEFAVSDPHIVNHSREFLKAVVSKRGEDALLKATTALAATVCKLFADKTLAASVRREFETFLKNR
ncbi:MAG: M20 family metallopeptidase [Nitrospinae bacterium]|nr:M20 family metallopeptidase [Nitrospinota bacterium]